MTAFKVNETNFEQEVLLSTLPVLIAFYTSELCGTAILDTVTELNDYLSGLVKVVKIDIDESPNLAVEYKVTSVPCFRVFHNSVTSIHREEQTRNAPALDILYR